MSEIPCFCFIKGRPLNSKSVKCHPLKFEGTRIAAFLGHTNRSVKLPSFMHFQVLFLTANRENGEKKTALCFARFVFLTFRGPLASHDSNPYPHRSRIARYNATKDCGRLTH